MKSLEIDWNYNPLPMTFSISLLIVLSRMIGLKAFEELYNLLWQPLDQCSIAALQVNLKADI